VHFCVKKRGHCNCHQLLFTRWKNSLFCLKIQRGGRYSDKAHASVLRERVGSVSSVSPSGHHGDMGRVQGLWPTDNPEDHHLHCEYKLWVLAAVLLFFFDVYRDNGQRLWTTDSERRIPFITVDQTGGETTVVLGL